MSENRFEAIECICFIQSTESYEKLKKLKLQMGHYEVPIEYKYNESFGM